MKEVLEELRKVNEKLDRLIELQSKSRADTSEANVRRQVYQAISVLKDTPFGPMVEKMMRQEGKDGE
jgi:hypothetical protein